MGVWDEIIWRIESRNGSSLAADIWSQKEWTCLRTERSKAPLQRAWLFCWDFKLCANHRKEELVKKIVITGASRGIGLFLATRLQDEGFHIIGIARNFSSDTNFEKLVCDVRSFGEVSSTFSNFKKDKSIYGLINCAGVLHTKPVISLTENEINETINTNFLGTVHCCKNIIRPLLASGIGRIINFSSI